MLLSRCWSRIAGLGRPFAGLRTFSTADPGGRHEDFLVGTPSEEDPRLVFRPPSRQEIFAKYPSGQGLVRQARVETLERPSFTSTGELLPLHPSVWSVMPRLDVIERNVRWQDWYKLVSYTHYKTRHELPDRTKRPWPQKGGGRARHSSIRSPLWIKGGKSKGPRSPRTFYYTLPYWTRVRGLIYTLATKFAQDDVHVVRDLDVPTGEPKFMEDLVDERGYFWLCNFIEDYSVCQNISCFFSAGPSRRCSWTRRTSFPRTSRRPLTRSPT